VILNNGHRDMGEHKLTTKDTVISLSDNELNLFEYNARTVRSGKAVNLSYCAVYCSQPKRQDTREPQGRRKNYYYTHQCSQCVYAPTACRESHITALLVPTHAVTLPSSHNTPSIRLTEPNRSIPFFPNKEVLGERKCLQFFRSQNAM
jgi:Pyruvate/2-oxoacid:ferredoxin oxidoreductase delta subunit